MGILDGIVEWIAEQVMNILDLITTSVLGALGCSMDTFLRYFPAAETMYDVFLARTAAYLPAGSYLMKPCTMCFWHWLLASSS